MMVMIMNRNRLRAFPWDVGACCLGCLELVGFVLAMFEWLVGRKAGRSLQSEGSGFGDHKMDENVGTVPLRVVAIAELRLDDRLGFLARRSALTRETLPGRTRAHPFLHCCVEL